MVLEESSDSDEGIQMEFPLRTSFIPKSRALEKIKGLKFGLIYKEIT